ncbi:hypothetical protein EJB05_40212, partial [Eragrostis curvula]
PLAQRHLSFPACTEPKPASSALLSSPLHCTEKNPPTHSFLRFHHVLGVLAVLGVPSPHLAPSPPLLRCHSRAALQKALVLALKKRKRLLDYIACSLSSASEL